jgi:lipoprotein-releasing system ATP-binding protein
MTLSSPPISPISAAREGTATCELRVVGLHKRYPTPAEPLVVLRDVSLSLRAGDSLAIIGPSGSGKSTLLNILGTLDRPTDGAVSLNGVDPFALAPDALARFRAEKIGFIFQDHHLLPQCSAIENVLLPRLALGKVQPGDADRARTLLQRVGLSNRATHLPAELSGGERQRVAVARAMMNGAALILADEPTGNLDAKAAEAVGDLLLDVTRESGAILIVVTHSAALAQRFGRQTRMSDGQLTDSARGVGALPTFAINNVGEAPPPHTQ